MNENSVICKLINDNPTTWQDIIKELKIRTKFEDNYAIFNYEITCDFSNKIVQEARGIIIDVVNKQVVCWPFRKFGNYTESYADKIDWSSAKVLEKVDGSIIKLWYDFSIDKWQFSTNGTIRAEKAPVEHTVNTFYGDIIKSAVNYKDIPFDKLDKNCTYIFELVSQITKVVISYDETKLYHLGTRNNITGKEFETDIGIVKPKLYCIGSLEDCIKSAVELNRTACCDQVLNEGYVVVDKNYNRVKIKSPDYIMMHHITMLKTIGKKECIDMLLNDRAKIDTICQKSPLVEPAVKYYDYKLAELICMAQKIGTLAQKLYEEYSHDRKAVALVLTKHRLGTIGFLCIDKNKSGKEVLLEMPLEKLIKYIPDYIEEDLTSIFLSE